MRVEQDAEGMRSRMREEVLGIAFCIAGKIAKFSTDVYIYLPCRGKEGRRRETMRKESSAHQSAVERRGIKSKRKREEEKRAGSLKNRRTVVSCREFKI